MTAIEFNHVSKMYQLGVVGTGTLSNDIKRWWATSIMGKEDPFLKVGQTNNRASKANGDFVYALKDIDFKVEQGDVVGIIGKNGAGKSTLLKLLSRITAPTTGVIKARGRIASLLEVGTGFHPELTGRENIYMNGSIMGMTKREIDSKLDEIVEFSGCEMYIDTPCKRYSSGMQVRLGFAVAAFLEPEILVVDEVLAVGDAEFQKKAIGKMQDVAHGQGRTVLFVSHNMNSVRQLCNSGVVLADGQVVKIGTADECVDFYMDTNISELVTEASAPDFKKGYSRYIDFEFTHVKLTNPVPQLATEEPLELDLSFVRKNLNIDKVQFCVRVINSADVCVSVVYTHSVTLPEGKAEGKVHVSIPNLNLALGAYKLDLRICQYDYTAVARDYVNILGALSFEVKYVDAAHKTPFSYWHRNMGNICNTSATVELI